MNGVPFLHGFGQRYDLPGPLFLYLFAAAGVVVLSFVMVVLFAGDRLGEEVILRQCRTRGRVRQRGPYSLSALTGSIRVA